MRPPRPNILPCGCKADSRGNPRGARFQDEYYGAGMRLHTPCKPNAPGDKPFRCTVCGAERQGTGAT